LSPETSQTNIHHETILCWETSQANAVPSENQEIKQTSYRTRLSKKKPEG